MAETFATIQAQVKDRVGRPGDTDSTLTTNVKRWVNDALREAQNRHVFKATLQHRPWYLRLSQNRTRYGTTAGFPSSFLAPAGEDWIFWLDPDTLFYVASSGTFTTSDTITGGTSSATAAVSAVATGKLTIASMTGVFRAGETITGSSSSATGVVEELADSDLVPVPLKPFNLRESIRRYAPDETGEPERYRLDLPATTTTGLEVEPKPDTQYTYCLALNYYGYFTELALDEDTNWLVAEHPMLLVAGATALAYEDMELLGEADRARAHFERELRNAKLNDKRERLRATGGRFQPSFGAKRGRRW